MARIKFIVTGVMEKKALPAALQKLFPAERALDGDQTEQVSWEQASKGDGFTSYCLPPWTIQNTAKQAKELAKMMLREARAGKYGAAADLVIVIDDVELGNLGQEANIAAHFKAAVEVQLKELALGAGEEDKLRQTLRKKCSFHLLKPMVEACLFADSEALAAAGMHAQPSLKHATNVEQFETTGPQDWINRCVQENAKKSALSPWWREEKHPKHYLLHFNPDYEETDHGYESLKVLDLHKIVQTTGDAPLFCALCEDLADWFGIPNPLGSNAKPDPHFYPAININRQSLLLRNM